MVNIVCHFFHHSLTSEDVFPKFAATIDKSKISKISTISSWIRSFAYTILALEININSAAIISFLMIYLNIFK
ncbi:hypothetical protein GF327_07355 [Candidatus Woesearchaeota archaeon]|nr:hypothetical protein [Candidatus Woesearchaeota archaeon]